MIQIVKKFVLISHNLRGIPRSVERATDIAATYRIVRSVVMEGEVLPLAPYLYRAEVLELPEIERARHVCAGWDLHPYQELWLCGEQLSLTMRIEVMCARVRGMRVFVKSAALRAMLTPPLPTVPHALPQEPEVIPLPWRVAAE